MAKSKLKAKTITVFTGGSPIRAAIRAEGAALLLFSDSDRNTVIRDAMYQGGEYWRLVYLPMRFTKYARTLGYNGGNDTPLVFTGRLIDMAIPGAHTEARATATKARATIRIPRPDYANLNKMVHLVLSALPANEVAQVARVVGKSVSENLDLATIHADLGKQSLSLDAGVKALLRARSLSPQSKSSILLRGRASSKGSARSANTGNARSAA